MAVIRKNEAVTGDIYLMEVGGAPKGRAGQFFMIKASDTLDVYLPRPISIHDQAEDIVTFLYQAKGKGTQLLSRKKAGEELVLTGPFGNGFTFEDADAAFVGGGVGTAPLYYAVKAFKLQFPQRKASVYLGFSEEDYRTEEFAQIADEVFVDVGGFITEKIDFSAEKVFYACGPEPMMRALSARCKESGRMLYVSLERRMACGLGACLGCSIPTKSGMRRVCKDGPVFPAGEVFYE